jgi:LacI family repressor for deo operon, udp, cdd, tsx, nupC, and nupG
MKNSSPSRKSSPTIRDMAAALGLSVATISRVLARPEMVKPETRKRVMKAIETMGYRPNFLAQALARSETRLAFFIVPILSPFFLDVMDGVEQAAQEDGYFVLMANARRDLQRIQTFYEQVAARRADGVLLLTGLLPPSLIPPKAVWPPTIIVAEPIDDPRGITVAVDHAEAAHIALRHLCGLGHKKIVHIGGPLRTLSSRERRRGFEEALRDAGLPFSPELAIEGNFDVETGEKAIVTFFENGIEPTAVFAANDEIALGAIRGAHRLGLRVPDDISIVGFDNQHFLEAFEPGLTTVNIPRFDIGYQAMKRLVRKIANDKDVTSLRLPTELIVRETTAPPRIGKKTQKKPM